MAEKRYKIIKRITLDFIIDNDQSTEYILPKNNARIIVDDKVVYLLYKRKKYETINPVGLINIYEKEGCIREENPRKPGKI